MLKDKNARQARSTSACLHVPFRCRIDTQNDIHRLNAVPCTNYGHLETKPVSKKRVFKNLHD